MSEQKNRNIPSSILDKVDESDASIFMKLWLSCDRAGILANTFELSTLKPLYDSGIINVTKQYVVLADFLSANHSNPLKENYNPHKGVRISINKAGFNYSIEKHSIIIPEDMLITDFPTLDQPSNNITVETPPITTEEPEAAEIVEAPTKVEDDKPSLVKLKNEAPKVQPMTKESKIIKFLRNPEFALILALLLMLGQTAHSSHSLMLLASLPEPYNTIFAISTALLMDLLIIYTVAVGNTRNSLIFFLWCAALNIFGYHINIEYWTYISIFTFIPAIGLPYAVHFVSTQMKTA